MSRIATANKNGIKFLVSHACRESLDWWENKYNNWESFTFEVFDKFLSRDMTYIDLGTFTGQTILYAAQKVKSAYGVDLDPEAYLACIGNVETNEYDNVKVENIAISSHDGEVGIEEERIGTSGCQMDPFSPPKVRSMTIESLMSLWGINKCDFLKMDIEGGEEFCLPHMKKFFRKYDPTFFLSVHTHLGATSDVIIEATESFKYVYDSSWNNVKDELKTIIDSRMFSHKNQDYLFTNTKQ